ncbi:MAG: histidine--tRNA ligase [Clostridia bacterium]|nr:histidine--tRNA ligase [Clostridia bacterium]
MAFIKTPVKGMNDFLPEDMRLREYVISVIKETYADFGFAQIETPMVEHIENLQSNQGGENEKLIFKILKRGEKLNLETAKNEGDLVDSGLRYDLTLPLARYYANNAEQLFTPFKALQIGNVFRADRPQKGRFRQFTQCDIDILGDETMLAETELISATSTLLLKLGFENFKVRVNDRRILKAMAASCNMPEENLGSVYISLDKLDKIGPDGVKAELIRNGFNEADVDAYLSMFLNREGKTCSELCGGLGEFLDPAVANGIDTLISNIKGALGNRFELEFDPTLVRGMGYYTGTIFEIEMAELNSSVAGGGRYDEMIGKFGANPTPACGFSIGFERIITILKDKGFKVPVNKKCVAFLVDKKASSEATAEVFEKAAKLRADGNRVMIAKRNKNAKRQKELLEKEGYTEINDVY